MACLDDRSFDQVVIMKICRAGSWPGVVVVTLRFRGSASVEVSWERLGFHSCRTLFCSSGVEEVLCTMLFTG